MFQYGEGIICECQDHINFWLKKKEIFIFGFPETSMGQITHTVRSGDHYWCSYTWYFWVWSSQNLTWNRFQRIFFDSFIVGYHIGVINSPAEYMKTWCKETLYSRYGLELTFDQLQTLWSAVVSIFLIGGCLGSLVGAWFADRFGRKLSLLNCGILFTLGAILFYLCRVCDSVEILVLARLIVGLASGLTTSILPMYLAEVAPLELRGTLAVLASTGSLQFRIISSNIWWILNSVVYRYNWWCSCRTIR